MYDIFGNMDSIEEINACAAGLLQEGDGERILELAEENGIPEVFAQDLIEGRSTELTDCMNAAIGKLDIEAAGYKNNQIPVEPILDYLKSQCTDEHFAVCVRRRTKSVKKCMELIEDNCKKIQKDTGKHYVADMTVFEWARDYFLEA